ncbi:hypothetical protein GGI04_002755 [Coemansia thaxteri]|uniref:Uncharacterized protein n=1 Tax=Coemansia thaxteri TaxID=2663907 RepID=A0A9W8BKD8_9FUNG|nr:hypothetical protein GGI04_002755 [Coemansia thaxteri]KAJ2005096.1 hypothetical protein H4R26_002143 [Coemansia thaxteri]
MFASKGPTSSLDLRGGDRLGATQLGAGTKQALRKQQSRLSTFRRSRLVARSPVREDSISPDLRALAGIDYPPSPTHGGEYVLPLDVIYSPTAFFTQTTRRSPHRVNTFTSASTQSQTTRSAHPRNRQASHAPVYGAFMFAPPSRSPSEGARSVVRSLSLDMVPELLPMSKQRQSHQHLSSPSDLDRDLRSSQGTESTAMPSLEILSRLIEADCQPNDCVASDCVSQKLNSPSQQTLELYPEALNVYDGAFTYMECPLPALPRLEADVFEASRAARRPYSEGFAEQAYMAEGDISFCDSSDSGSLASAPSNQRAMYIRNSCADSGLVKSAFDLVKLLPSAPQ